MTLAGAVSGAGLATIDDGTLAVEAAGFAQAVRFTGASGTLDLAQSRSFAGSVAGFAGGDVLDLGDIAFTNAGEASFSGDASGGTLTVSDGTNTASIRLLGNYLGDTFVAASDGAGGVSITAMAAGPPSPTPSSPPWPGSAGRARRPTSSPVSTPKIGRCCSRREASRPDRGSGGSLLRRRREKETLCALHGRCVNTDRSGGRVRGPGRVEVPERPSFRVSR